MTKVGPPKPPNHRWHAAQDRNTVLAVNWQGFKTFVDAFTTSDDTKSAKARFLREELARMRPDDIHNEVGVQLEFALAVDIGVHLRPAPYLLEGDRMLVSFSLLFVVLTCGCTLHTCLLWPPSLSCFLFVHTCLSSSLWCCGLLAKFAPALSTDC